MPNVSSLVISLDTPKRSTQYVVFLGRERDLAFAELDAVVQADGFQKPERLTPSTAHISYDRASIGQLQTILGGTVKVGDVVAIHNKIATEAELLKLIQNAADTIVTVLLQDRKQLSGKTPFSIHIDPSVNVSIPKKVIHEALKNYLSQRGINARFIFGGEDGLSSVQVTTQHIIDKGFELCIFLSGSKMYVAKTVTVQNYKDWSKRDFGRPVSDPRRGMLPPKLARMMLNVARGTWRVANGKSATDLAMLDPFCGEGTVLMEGLQLGMHVFGSDIDGNAILDTKKNLTWFLENFTNTTNKVTGQVKKINTCDIKDVPRNFDAHSIDIIVTEPFLGPPAKKQLQKYEIDKVTRIYTSLFTSLLATARAMQKPAGILSVVVPKARDRQFSRLLLDKTVLDSCEKFGYTFVKGPYSYARPDAKIGREIYFFKKRVEV